MMPVKKETTRKSPAKKVAPAAKQTKNPEDNSENTRIFVREAENSPEWLQILFGLTIPPNTLRKDTRTYLNGSRNTYRVTSASPDYLQSRTLFLFLSKSDRFFQSWRICPRHTQPH